MESNCDKSDTSFTNVKIFFKYQRILTSVRADNKYYNSLTHYLLIKIVLRGQLTMFDSSVKFV